MNERLISSESKKGIIIIRINRNIDKVNFNNFRMEFDEIIANSSEIYILLNLRKLDHINSLFISLLLKIYKEKKFSEIYLTNVNERIKNILSMLNLENIVKIKETEEDVLKDIG